MVLLCQLVLSQDEPMVLMSRIRMTRMCRRTLILILILTLTHYHCLLCPSWLVSWTV